MSKIFIANIAKVITNNNIKDNSIKNIENRDELLGLIKYHQILPFIHHFKNIIQNKFSYIDDEVLFKSQEQSMKNLCRSMVYIDFLKKTSPPEFIMTKGFLLGYKYYGDIGLRTFNDMDIFINLNNYNIWMEFLRDNKFKKYGNATDTFPDEIIKKYSFAQHFINEENNIAIDLHLNISNKMHPFQFNFQDFESNQKQVNIEGININTFSVEYLIVYLLYHSFKHYYFKLIWFIDLYKIFADNDYDANLLTHLIQKFRIQNLICYYLSISTKIFGNTGIPKDSEILDKFSPKYTEQINENAVLNGEYSTSNSFNRLLLPMYFLPNVLSKFQYLRSQIFPPYEILPEYYTLNSHSNLSYIKNRFNRINRLLRKDNF